MRAPFLTIALLSLLSSGCIAPDLRRTNIIIGDASLYVWIADTQDAREHGLMNVQKLGEKEGMLFVYEQPGVYPFWMKNTVIPLDIIFVSENMTVVDIQQMELCVDDPCKLYIPRSEVMYVIEVNQGFAERKNITEGQELKIG